MLNNPWAYVIFLNLENKYLNNSRLHLKLVYWMNSSLYVHALGFSAPFFFADLFLGFSILALIYENI